MVHNVFETRQPIFQTNHQDLIQIKGVKEGMSSITVQECYDIVYQIPYPATIIVLSMKLKKSNNLMEN